MFNFFKKKEPKKIANNVEVKCCIKCEKVLPLTKFSRHNRSKDGLRTKCRWCTARPKIKSARPKGKLSAGNEYIKITIKDIPVSQYSELVTLAKDKNKMMNQIYQEAITQYIKTNS